MYNTGLKHAFSRYVIQDRGTILAAHQLYLGSPSLITFVVAVFLMS